MNTVARRANFTTLPASRVATVMTWCILVSLLILGFNRGNAFAYPALLLALAGLLVRPWRATYAGLFAEGWLWMLPAAFGLVMLSAFATARIPYELLDWVYFLPLLLAVPAAAVFARTRIQRPVLAFAALALGGTIMAMAVCVYRVARLGFGRIAPLQISPIHFADLVVIVGFMALAGLMAAKSRWRWLFLLGPVLGLVCGGLSGTRAVVVVAAPLLLLAAIYLVRTGALRLRVLVGVVLGLIAAAVLLVLLGLAAGETRSLEAFGILSEIVSGKTLSDQSVAFRFDQYQAALKVIGDWHLFGVGRRHQFEYVLPYMSAAGQAQYAVEHWGYVHNDGLFLTVIAGLPGLAAYLLLMGYPLVALWRAPRDALAEPRAYLVLTFTIGFIISGMSDATFSTELPKTMFCMLPAAIVILCREPREIAQ
ncbi:MAG: O-antigen ligase family protein [Devosia sp.]